MESQLRFAPARPQASSPLSLAEALEGVARCAGEVVERRVDLVQADIERGLTRLGLLVFAASLAGVLMGALWIAATAAVAWLTQASLGTPAALAGVVLLQCALVAAAFVLVRALRPHHE